MKGSAGRRARLHAPRVGPVTLALAPALLRSAAGATVVHSSLRHQACAHAPGKPTCSYSTAPPSSAACSVPAIAERPTGTTATMSAPMSDRRALNVSYSGRRKPTSSTAWQTRGALFACARGTWAVRSRACAYAQKGASLPRDHVRRQATKNSGAAPPFASHRGSKGLLRAGGGSIVVQGQHLPQVLLLLLLLLRAAPGQRLPQLVERRGARRRGQRRAPAAGSPPGDWRAQARWCAKAPGFLRLPAACPGVGARGDQIHHPSRIADF